jgi:hypothetical protein
VHKIMNGDGLAGASSHNLCNEPWSAVRARVELSIFSNGFQRKSQNMKIWFIKNKQFEAQ